MSIIEEVDQVREHFKYFIDSRLTLAAAKSKANIERAC